MDVTVVVATYGDAKWAWLAARRAIPSAALLEVPILTVHGADLHGARNAGLGRVETEWVCFLDGDDELEAGYFDAIGQADGDLRAPAVRYVRNERPSRPAIPRVAGHTHDCEADCLAFGNWLVVGTVARTALVREAGGWKDWPMFEDWDLWARCWLLGATVSRVPQAVYRAHVRRDSRNRAPGRAEKHSTHQAIARALGLPVPA